MHKHIGIVPGHGKAEIEVTFAPTEFNTAVMTLQVTLQDIMCVYGMHLDLGTFACKYKQQERLGKRRLMEANS